MAKPKNVDERTIYVIRSLYFRKDKKITQFALAKKFKLSQSTICKIINFQIHKGTELNLGGEADIRIGYRYGDQG